MHAIRAGRGPLTLAALLSLGLALLAARPTHRPHVETGRVVTVELRSPAPVSPLPAKLSPCTCIPPRPPPPPPPCKCIRPKPGRPPMARHRAAASSEL